MLIRFLYYVYKFTIGALPRKTQVYMPGATVKISFASTVFIDRESQTATKVYTPSLAVRALYWLAFQSKYPYSSNLASLIAAKYRRDVARRLTFHHFGREVVAPIIDITPVGSWFALRSELVIGDDVVRDRDSLQFLVEVKALFDSFGFPVWQVNHQSPSAYRNLIKTPEGYKIIDLESGLPSPTPIIDSWRRTVEAGYIPMFDDIDFDRLKGYIDLYAGPLASSFGEEGMSLLRSDVDCLELATQLWKSGERRLWGRSISWLYQRFGN